jgi:hypothetical protein
MIRFFATLRFRVFATAERRGTLSIFAGWLRVVGGDFIAGSPAWFSSTRFRMMDWCQARFELFVEDVRERSRRHLNFLGFELAELQSPNFVQVEFDFLAFVPLIGFRWPDHRREMEKNIVPEIVSSNKAKLSFVDQFDNLADSHAVNFQFR